MSNQRTDPATHPAALVGVLGRTSGTPGACGVGLSGRRRLGFLGWKSCAVGFEVPRAPAPSKDEREVLLGYIRWQREQVVATADGLSEEQLRWTPKGRLLPIIGIINHLTHMEWRWIEGRYLGSPFPLRDEEFVLGDTVTGAEVIDSYSNQAQRTESVVRAARDLTEPCLGDEGGRGPAAPAVGLRRAGRPAVGSPPSSRRDRGSRRPRGRHPGDARPEQDARLMLEHPRTVSPDTGSGTQKCVPIPPLTSGISAHGFPTRTAFRDSHETSSSGLG